MGDKVKNAVLLPVSMGDKKPPAAPPVSIGDMKPPTPFPAVRLVCWWALGSACYFTIVVVVNVYGTECSDSSWWTKCYDLTGANADAWRALLNGLMWCIAPQAAAAAAALLLAGRHRRIRLALAFVALALTVANHIMYAWLTGLIFVATSGDLLGVLLVLASGTYFFPAAVLALLCFFALLLAPILGAEYVD